MQLGPLLTIHALKQTSGSGTLELKCLVTKLFLDAYKFSSLVVGSNMNYWWSFKIKISHRDSYMYTKNHYV